MSASFCVYKLRGDLVVVTRGERVCGSTVSSGSQVWRRREYFTDFGLNVWGSDAIRF